MTYTPLSPELHKEEDMGTPVSSGNRELGPLSSIEVPKHIETSADKKNFDPVAGVNQQLKHITQAAKLSDELKQTGLTQTPHQTKPEIKKIILGLIAPEQVAEGITHKHDSSLKWLATLAQWLMKKRGYDIKGKGSNAKLVETTQKRGHLAAP